MRRDVAELVRLSLESARDAKAQTDAERKAILAAMSPQGRREFIAWLAPVDRKDFLALLEEIEG